MASVWASEESTSAGSCSAKKRKPVATISAPTRLAGLRCHAIRPAATNDPPVTRYASCQAVSGGVVADHQRPQRRDLACGAGRPEHDPEAAAALEGRSELQTRPPRRLSGSPPRLLPTAIDGAPRVGYSHGISARTRVPPPRGLQTLRRPSSASTRSARPRRPGPRLRVRAADSVVHDLDDQLVVRARDHRRSRTTPRRTWPRSSGSP